MLFNLLTNGTQRTVVDPVVCRTKSVGFGVCFLFCFVFVFFFVFGEGVLFFLFLVFS